MDTPDPFGDVGSQHAVLHKGGEIKYLALFRIPAGDSAGSYRQKPGVLQQRLVLRPAEVLPGKLLCSQQIHVYLRGGHRADHIHKLADQGPANPFRMLFHGVVGHAGRKVRIVQDPDGHAVLFGLVDDDIDIVPPAFAGIIRMGSRLQADGTDAGLPDFSQLGAQGLFAFPSHPQERENVIVVHAVHLVI